MFSTKLTQSGGTNELTAGELLYVQTVAALGVTKGNLMATDGSAWGVLGVGTNGQVLTADSTQTYGVKWATVTGTGDMVLADVQTVTGAKTFGTIGGAVGKFILAGSTSGSTIVNAAAVAGSTTITLPGATDTLVGLATTDTLTNKTLTSPNINEAVALTSTSTKLNYLTSAGGTTGTTSTNIVFSTSPTLVTPILGTPTSGTLTNCTGLPISGLTSSTSTALGVGSIELGHASDTTISRVSAGVAAIEGVNILTTAGGTLTGNITLGENTSIDFDPAGSADGKYSGLAVTGTAGEALAFGDVVVLDVTAGKWFKGSVSASAGADGDLRGGTGMCVLAAAGDASATKILLHGTCRADANFPTLTVGSVVYATTSGDITVTQPTTTDHIIKVLGFALTADEIMFCPSMDYTTHT